MEWIYEQRIIALETKMALQEKANEMALESNRMILEWIKEATTRLTKVPDPSGVEVALAKLWIDGTWRAMKPFINIPHEENF